MFTPVGAGITAAGLGIDAYKYGKKRISELQAMSPEERAGRAMQPSKKRNEHEQQRAAA